jgi:hypothetical protein
MQKRLEMLLTALRTPSSATLRTLRAIRVLEYVGTPEASEVLRALSGGAPEARVTEEAKEALDRLGNKGVGNKGVGNKGNNGDP